MRRHPQGALPEPATGQRHDLTTIKTLLPYLWSYKGRVFLALACLLGAKVANVGVPIVFKHMVDALSITPEQAFIVVPAALVMAYGALRFMTSMLTELRELIFARVTQQAVRNISLQVFRHLHALSLRFHLERQTGGLTRDIERGTRSIGSLISYTLYSILPTLVEVGLVIGILYVNYDPIFSIITAVALTLYISFTVKITNWRTALRRKANELDSAANARAIDSLLNFETVKYFNNEEFEARRYDDQLRQWADAQIKNQLSLSGLNIGQAAIIAIAVTSMLWQASIRVVDGSMTLGDIVLVNAYMLQLYIPLNFLGVIYREIRQALTDIERMFGLLNQPREIADKPNASSLAADNATVRFEKVSFAYDPARQILFEVDFEIPAGKTVAVVGHSGSGKSTLGRLLFRFYDVTGGRITINGTDIRDLQQDSLRQAIGIVPQDTVLFNDTLRYNIQYGRPEAADGLIDTAAAAAQLTDFIGRLPNGYEARVGERGLKLSGGEKQRVAIARALLKDPAILIFDEATSALDSRTEKAIQAQIDLAARGRTALIIAHRLSTIAHADEILVLDQGHIVERGRHHALLAANGAYAQMWRLQQQEASEADSAK
ncbi:ABCB family ABC transporter ATP-binding protein/permease [Denitromonas ohlonensis]|uniref:ABC transporter ATP-binding protein/permease n=2 Tax=Denitromonas TaxID=139331 RepID=A0A557SKV3_9RHOO|nr:ABC transporter ATP-binding protein/permease [Denitromonas ohlonensis]TVO68051.1 ABC transporter ATP-binding protein/permease [Denitromonas ohlonensis]TVO78044.1 ABC transporter ATP-binding protein/permease [Denitromonas ohlonensis]TVT45320.1 MAG: ABC transporter ATP-binding protein/permease [Denitromonas halophila]TVT69866.1 MAG: ABC transporter ATP-binding protein/permease [Denitromonas halophila]